MNNKNSKLKLLNIHRLSKNDPHNLQNIDIEKKMEEARVKRRNDVSEKIIIINNHKIDNNK